MAQSAIFKLVLQQIEVRQSDKPFIIGINGIDTSGKTVFARRLTDFLAASGLKTQLIHLDDFHNPKAVRYSGTNPADSYYQNSFNFALLATSLLIPAKEGQSIRTNLTLLDLETDNFTLQRDYAIDNDTIVVVEGVFLFRPELRNYFDYKIYLEVSFEEVMRRVRERDLPLFGDSIFQKYADKYMPAQRKYIEEHRPAEQAQLVIDNTKYDCPIIITNTH
jgi:uridine kinase